MALNSYQSVLAMQSFKIAKPMPPVGMMATCGAIHIEDKYAFLSANLILLAPGVNIIKNYLEPISIIHSFNRGIVHRNSNVFIQDQCDSQSNMRFDRTADAGHKACGASFTPKAHRFPRSAVGDVRRSAHRGR